MRRRLIEVVFIFIGILIGIILAMQVQANPIRRGSSELDQIAVQKSLLESFSVEQEELRQALDQVETKLSEAEAVIERQTSRQTVRLLQELKELTGRTEKNGIGMTVTLQDNLAVSRIDFSQINESFVQVTDIRDLINMLFVHGAKAIAVNEKRVMPLTPIQSVFDQILIGNGKVAPPFVIEVLGDPIALKEALKVLNGRKIEVYTDLNVPVTIPPADTTAPAQYLKSPTQ